jgi:hypothetical protein
MFAIALFGYFEIYEGILDGYLNQTITTEDELK